MKEDNPIRIVIADDHPVVREGLAAMIERRPDMTVVGEARDGLEAVALYESMRPDVLLMDLNMPHMNGVAAIEAIRANYPAARIIVLTTFDGDEDIYRGLRAGARGYLLKDAGREELLRAIRSVQAGNKVIPPDVASKLADRMSSDGLTPRELEVLRLMAGGHSNQEIGKLLFITEGTVKAHVKSILAKMEAGDRTQAVTKAIRRGVVHLD